MHQLIINKKHNIYKSIAGILIAIWTVNSHYLLYFNWLILVKLFLILWLFGLGEFYYFDSNKKQLRVTTFLKYPIIKQNFIKSFPEYISIYKSTSSESYELYLYSNRKKRVVLNTNNYNELCLKANQISHLLAIQFYNPYESYD
jgi:hypothetical protein